jgi:hypothetical protein
VKTIQCVFPVHRWIDYAFYGPHGISNNALANIVNDDKVQFLFGNINDPVMFVVKVFKF